MAAFLPSAATVSPLGPSSGKHISSVTSPHLFIRGSRPTFARKDDYRGSIFGMAGRTLTQVPLATGPAAYAKGPLCHWPEEPLLSGDVVTVILMTISSVAWCERQRVASLK